MGNDDKTTSKKTLMGFLFGGKDKTQTSKTVTRTATTQVKTSVRPAMTTSVEENIVDSGIEGDGDKTTSKTIWSETLIDLLTVTLQKNRPDDEVRKLLMDLQKKGFKRTYLVDKVTRSVGEAAANRVKRLLTS